MLDLKRGPGSEPGELKSEVEKVVAIDRRKMILGLLEEARKKRNKVEITRFEDLLLQL